MKRLLVLLFLTLAAVSLYAAAPDTEKKAPLEINARLDHADCLYSLGDSALFSVEIMRNSGRKAPFTVSYRLSEDGERTLDEGSRGSKDGRLSFSGKLDRPGFLRLELTAVSGADTVRKTVAGGFDPRAIRPTNILPEDFDRFWREARAQLWRTPVDAQVQPVADTTLPGAAHYLVSLGNVNGTRVYGRLAVPEGQGPFPAVLMVPGAGVGVIKPWGDYIRAGFLCLAIDVHGIPQDREDSYYRNLNDALLSGYQLFGCDDPYQYYYRRVIQGCFRALDYLASRPDVDTTRLAIAGSSQGGALSLLVAGLDSRIKALTANVPAMCDHTGSLYGRPSGWPRLLRADSRDCVRRTSAYYDAALNAGLINVPARLAVGFIDRTCAPTSVYAAFNNIKGPKIIDNYPDMGHSFGPDWQKIAGAWLLERLNESKAARGGK
ncbi:acetylxylan esterase [bacterium]|nr:acetylxylan esterase [bacterium]